MPQVFANSSRAKLTAALTASATTIAIDNGAPFPVANHTPLSAPSVDSPESWFKVVLQSETAMEIAYVRTHASGGNSFTNVLRGQEGTAAAAFAVDDVVAIRPLADDMYAAINQRVIRTGRAASALMPAGSTAERDATPVLGMFRYNSELATFEGYINGVGWAAFGSADLIEQVFEITATAGQTSFPASYTPGQIGVYKNGSRLAAADYTATTGTLVVLGAPAAAGDIIAVVSHRSAKLVDAVAKSGDTMSGPLRVPAGATGDAAPQAQEVVSKAGDAMTGNLTLPSINHAPIGGMRNRIINGDMRVFQRNGLYTTAPASARTYILDRWRINNDDVAGAVIGVSSVAGPDSEFTNALEVRQFANASPLGASTMLAVEQIIESANCRRLVGRPVSVSFMAFSNKVGKFSVALTDRSTTTYVKQFEFTSVNVWQKFSLTIEGGLPSGANWGAGGAEAGLRLLFVLAAGSGFVGSPTDVWGPAGTFAGADQASWTADGNIFRLTAVQLEQGSLPTAFEYRPYSLELSLCQRYYFRFGNTNPLTLFVRQAVAASTSVIITPIFAAPVPMRAVPTVSHFALTISNPAGDTQVSTVSGISLSGGSGGEFTFSITAATGLTTGSLYGVRLVNTGTPRIELNAELA